MKKYIAPLSNDLRELVRAYQQVDGYKALLGYAGYAGDPALDMMEPYVGQLSGELLESFEYLRRYHLYDMDPGDTKTYVGYSADLPHYGTAFIFDSPSGGIIDFQTAIHEFGH